MRPSVAWFPGLVALLALVWSRGVARALVADEANAVAGGEAERVIVPFGDSLTAGFGVLSDEAYPALLEARLRREGYAYRVVNAGVSGDTAAAALRRLD